MAVRDQTLADAIARAIESVDPKLILFAPDKSELTRVGEARGLHVAREIFADRNYLNDGWLVPRTRPDALLRDPKEAAERVMRMLREARCAPSKAATSRCAVKRFACMAIRPAQLSSRVNYAHGWSTRA
jgi:lactam utilization protein B